MKKNPPDDIPFRPDWTGRLLAWYDANRRILPWRERPEPYRVWVSEIMLQQTRSDVVIPYFERFMERLPDIADLATVDDDTLYKLWEGLGYYRRARHMKQAAGIVMARFEGRLPADPALLATLPGIGPYSAGAIASIAFGMPVPAVDGNVRRVIARLFGLTPDGSATTFDQVVEDVVRRHIPAERPGDYTQALMELGALVCLPNGTPKCAGCPGATDCVARRDDCIDALPGKRPTPPRRVDELTVFVIVAGDGVLLEKRPEGGLLSGLWGLPTIAGHLTSAAARDRLAQRGFEVLSLHPLPHRTHVFTHVTWSMTGYLAIVADSAMSAAGTFFPPAEIVTMKSVPTAFRPLLETAIVLKDTTLRSIHGTSENPA